MNTKTANRINAASGFETRISLDPFTGKSSSAYFSSGDAFHGFSILLEHPTLEAVSRGETFTGEYRMVEIEGKKLLRLQLNIPGDISSSLNQLLDVRKPRNLRHLLAVIQEGVIPLHCYDSTTREPVATSVPLGQQEREALLEAVEECYQSDSSFLSTNVPAEFGVEGKAYKRNY